MIWIENIFKNEILISAVSVFVYCCFFFFFWYFFLIIFFLGGGGMLTCGGPNGSVPDSLLKNKKDIIHTVYFNSCIFRVCFKIRIIPRWQ